MKDKLKFLPIAIIWVASGMVLSWWFVINKTPEPALTLSITYTAIGAIIFGSIIFKLLK